MFTPVLKTKLFIPPPRPGIVTRSGLIERLNEGLNCKLTLISAPAGFGKTTLVSEWVASCQQPVAWLSLDEGDNDPAVFLTYLISALQTVVPKVGEGILGTLQAPQSQPPSIELLLATLINELTAISDNFILVLDDYHVTESQAINQALIFLIDHLPSQLHLIVATREDPPFPLARWRACSRLTELRAANLRFTPAEAAEFLNQAMGLNLSTEDIAALEARTEGWIVGLQLAALSMQGRHDIAGFIRAFTGSHRFVLDYLVEEVLQRQSEHIRSFLLQTAILDRFNASLCDAVTERENGKEMLDLLERSNLFLIPLDDQRQWYRYHHLFAEVLQTHLTDAQDDRDDALHRRASVWYERNGLRAEAIRHALAAEDLVRAADLIELAGPATEDKSIQPATWLGWVRKLPDELVSARPVLNVWYAYALLGNGEMEAAEARFMDAERWLEPVDTMKAQLANSSVEMVVVDQEQFKYLPATIAIGRAYIAQAFGNIPDTVRYASRVLELVPEGDNFRRQQASMMLGMTHWASGDLEAADWVFADYTMKLRKAGNIPDAISTTVVVADIRLALGRLREAIITVQQLLRYVMDQGEPISPDTADLYRELGELYLEQGNPEAAAEHLQRSQELGEKAELPVWRYRWCIARARLNETQGNLDGALALLDEAERRYIRTPLPNSRPISTMKARIWVAQGRLAQALDWVRQQGLSPDDDISYLREFDYITLARILIAQYLNDRKTDSIQAVKRLLDRLLLAAEEGGRIGSVIEILAMQAFAHQAQGNTAPALLHLKRAMSLAEPEGYVLIFKDESKPMAGLLTRLEDKGGTPSPQSLIEPLSERELEVLRLLRTDLSGPEIARQSMVSLSTVRTHTQRIYAKLGVNNRRAAVRRAQELGLL